MHEEYKIEWDLKLAQYFRSLIIRCGETIYDLDCLDHNLPPISAQYSDSQFLMKQTQNQFALNLTLQDRIKEVETECLQLHHQAVTIRHQISNDPHYVRALFSAYKTSKTEKFISKRRQLAMK